MSDSDMPERLRLIFNPAGGEVFAELFVDPSGVVRPDMPQEGNLSVDVVASDPIHSIRQDRDVFRKEGRRYLAAVEEVLSRRPYWRTERIDRFPGRDRAGKDRGRKGFGR